MPSEAQFSAVNAEFSERGFTEACFDDYVRICVDNEPDGAVSCDSAPITVRAKASNA